MRIDGSVAIVTGASSGIGAATAACSPVAERAWCSPPGGPTGWRRSPPSSRSTGGDH